MSTPKQEYLSREQTSQAKNILEGNSQPVPFSGCWLWLRGGYGYGRIRLPGAGKLWLAHRLSFLAYCGPLVTGRAVLHSCDTPLCINPGHLRQGTQLDNMRDKMRKGRHRVGRGNRKLKTEQVIAIRALFADGRRPSAIAAELGLLPRNVYMICNNESWKDLTDVT